MLLSTVQQLAMASLVDDGLGVENQHDLSVIDASETERVSIYFSKGCGCKLGPSCSSVLTKGLAVQCRNNFQQLEDSELDKVVLSQLQALHTYPDQPLHETRRSSDASPQHHTFFYFRKLRICLETFLFVHSIGHSRFKSLQHHFSVGHFQRVHGNTKRLPSNVSSQECVDCVIAFIDTTANVHCLEECQTIVI